MINLPLLICTIVALLCIAIGVVKSLRPARYAPQYHRYRTRGIPKY